MAKQTMNNSSNSGMTTMSNPRTYTRTTSLQDRATRSVSNLLRYLVLFAFVVVFLGPFVLIFFWAFKLEPEIARAPFSPPIPFHLENLARVWTAGRYNIYLPNTIIYSVSITAGVCVLSCLAGYALARLPLLGRKLLLNMFLLGMLVPFFSLMIPIYLLLRDFNILGTRQGLIIACIALGLPFGIFLLRSFFMSLPSELGDAGKIDGCGEWGVFRHIMLPLATPGILGLAVFQWIWSWNMFLEPLLFVQKDDLRPVGTRYPFLSGKILYGSGDGRHWRCPDYHTRSSDLCVSAAEVRRRYYGRGTQVSCISTAELYVATRFRQKSAENERNY